MEAWNDENPVSSSKKTRPRCRRVRFHSRGSIGREELSCALLSLDPALSKVLFRFERQPARGSKAREGLLTDRGAQRQRLELRGCMFNNAALQEVMGSHANRAVAAPVRRRRGCDLWQRFNFPKLSVS